MISEGSCDTKDWNNDAEISTLYHRNTFHYKIYSNRKQLFKIVLIFHSIADCRAFVQKQHNANISQ